ncbi:MAG: FemAB family PEP-CTERM system-associated protein [Pirellulaceae bacterium]|nr:FemAB family PEP-CTERM system-associated protein [Pirellulaceae bacterium]
MRSKRIPVDYMEHEQRAITYRVHDRTSFPSRMGDWEALYSQLASSSASRHPRWMMILQQGLGQTPYCVEATKEGQCLGILPLVHVKSPLFGAHLVSLPYLNTGGFLADSCEVRTGLITQAVELADKTGVRHLQLRNEDFEPHDQLKHTLRSKVHMRLPLPKHRSELWDNFKPKVRNQVRNAKKKDVRIEWGNDELLDDFYSVFTRNMRDLGTPVFGKKLFRAILEQLPGQAEFCLGFIEAKPIAGALLLHGEGTTEVPSASSLRAYNRTNANMLMYWELLQRAIEREQNCFDFGRSSPDSPTYRFKKQWGACPEEANWQHYVRRGNVEDTRIESGKYDRFVKIWRRLPLPIANSVGPMIVRGIP